MARRGLAAACLPLTGLLAAVSGGAAEGAPTGRSPNTSLIGVATTGPNNAWAAGYFQSGTTNKTLILHWTGKSWHQLPTPNPTPAMTRWPGSPRSRPATPGRSATPAPAA